jgi:uroporphyrin-3 C-methyltransferase
VSKQDDQPAEEPSEEAGRPAAAPSSGAAGQESDRAATSSTDKEAVIVASERQNPPQAAEPVNPNQGGGSSGIAWLALLLVIGLGAGAGWFFVETHKRESDLLDRMQSLESKTTELAATASGLETTTRSLAARTDALDSKTGSLDSLTGNPQVSGGLRDDDAESVDLQALDQRWELRLQKAVSEAAAELAGDVARQSRQLQELAAQLAARGTEPNIAINRDSWMLAEVEYLLRLANQRMLLAGDTATAEALLSSVDKILRDLDDVSLLGVRRAVTSDLASIRAVPKIDTEGSYLRLAALIKQVERLVIFELPEPETPVVEEVSDSWQGQLRRGYQEALAKLSSYLVVRRRDTPAEALMDPHWERLVRENLRMLLEQAQVALLSGNQRLYRESLDRSRHWVAEFFLTDELAAEAMEREISELMEQTIAVDLPDISDSMREFDAAVGQRGISADGEQAPLLEDEGQPRPPAAEAQQALPGGEDAGLDPRGEG